MYMVLAVMYVAGACKNVGNVFVVGSNCGRNVGKCVWCEVNVWGNWVEMGWVWEDWWADLLQHVLGCGGIADWW